MEDKLTANLCESERIFKRFFMLHRAKLTSLGEKENIFPGQMPILVFTACNDGLSQTDIAKAFKLKAASVTEALKRMEKSGLIIREQDTSDLRRTCVYISDKGKELVKNGIDISYKMETCCFKGFTEEEKAAFICFLKRMCSNLDDSDGGAE